MRLLRAKERHLTIVKEITDQTIDCIYPNYYPAECVKYFKNHHSPDEIREDIIQQIVLLVETDGDIVGTGTLCGNSIGRLFILPEHQGKGYGRILLDELERIAGRRYSFVTLSASLPSFAVYEKRGYFPVKYNQLPLEHGAVLCFHTMEKHFQK